MFNESFFEIEGEKYSYFELKPIFEKFDKLRTLPIALKILLENNLREIKTQDEAFIILDIFLNKKTKPINLTVSSLKVRKFSNLETLLQFSSLREFYKNKNLEYKEIKPKVKIELLLKELLHNSIYTDLTSHIKNNQDKYEFIKYLLSIFDSFIVRDTLLEDELPLIIKEDDNKKVLTPYTTLEVNNQTSISNLGLLSININNIEAEAYIFDVKSNFLLPKVIGINIKGFLKQDISSFEIVQYFKTLLADYSCEGKIVEFYGESLKDLSIELRKEILKLFLNKEILSCFFPIDNQGLSIYDNQELIKTYLQKQELFYENQTLVYDETIIVDLNSIETLIKVEDEFFFTKEIYNKLKIEHKEIELATIFFTLNKINEKEMISAALLCKKACAIGLKIAPMIKQAFIFLDYKIKIELEKLDLLKYFFKLGFTFIDFENKEELKRINQLNNRPSLSNFSNVSKVIHSNRSTYELNSNLLIAYCIKGSIKVDIRTTVIDSVDEDTYFKDIYPKEDEVLNYINKIDFKQLENENIEYLSENKTFKDLVLNKSLDNDSTYVKAPLISDILNIIKMPIKQAGILAILGDNITTNDILLSGQIPLYSSCAKYLDDIGIKSYAYDTFENRSLNIEIMKRAMFCANDLNNKMINKQGGFTKDYISNQIISIIEKTDLYNKKELPLVIFAGENFGIGEQTKFSAKGIFFLGVKVIIAKSFDPIYKKNLISYGVLPLEFLNDDINSLCLKGDEVISIVNENDLCKDRKIELSIVSSSKEVKIRVLNSIESKYEYEIYKNGGLLNSFLNYIK